MTPEDLAGLIDLSILRPDATKKDIEELLRKAMQFPFASVCVPPSYVEFAGMFLAGRKMNISTVVGFPMGYQTTHTKVTEAKEAVEKGAGEVDMVMNISAFKSGETAAVEEDIKAVVSAVPRTVVKVIIETCYLTYQEKVYAVDTVVRAGAHFVKTSTGFGPGGATVDDVKLLKETAGGRIKIKAAGGIRNLDAALEMIEAGADRIGTSVGAEIVEDFQKKEELF